MSVTIQDVARAAGVSKATVSKVLNHSYTISGETTERVNTVIRELGYRPNRRAQSFASKATKTVLFLAEIKHGAGFDKPHLFEMLAGIENTLSQKGYGLIVKSIGAGELCENFDELLHNEFADGAILHASTVSGETAKLLADSELPYVVIGMPDFSNRLCWIDTDNSVAGQIAARHLQKCGYRRIAFIGGPGEDRISAHRQKGALSVLEGTLPEGYLLNGQPDSEGGREAAERLMALPEPPDAVICANQYIAYGCVNALKASGVRIPGETAVITFDDFPFSRVMDPPLTVVNLDMYDVGEQAARIVLRRVKKPQLVIQSQTTLPVLIERSSTGR